MKVVMVVDSSTSGGGGFFPNRSIVNIDISTDCGDGCSNGPGARAARPNLQPVAPEAAAAESAPSEY